jgi:hypothetical protein
MDIELHIERLVLDSVGAGMSHADRDALQVAVTAELTRLLGAQSVQAGLLLGGAVPALRVGDLALPAGQPQPIQLGQSIAGVVHGGLTGNV